MRFTIALGIFLVPGVCLAEVDMFIGTDAVTFIEKTRLGGTTTTTIIRDRHPPYAALHSRNTVILGQLGPEQMSGERTID